DSGMKMGGEQWKSIKANRLTVAPQLPRHLCHWSGGCGIIAGMFVGFFVWFVREPDRLMWAGFLAAGFVGGVVGALFTRINREMEADDDGFLVSSASSPIAQEVLGRAASVIGPAHRVIGQRARVGGRCLPGSKGSPPRTFP